ncbi:MAG: flagellar hook-basal body complex protein FliE [Bryobacteraceae bacterium]|nr:flagellar hook-basal body complex protein FliE [Bryobacteraceae bacterium]MDW8376752.1 flagellar hook-basal body complex protein FliE [Bryobacterales bacterium]
MEPIRPILAPRPLESVTLDKVSQKQEPSFASILEKALGHVSAMEAESRQKVDRFLRGEEQELHDMMLSVQRASLTFDLFLQVRNKVMQAYQEVMRMQL